jgi:hypothetical protein
VNEREWIETFATRLEASLRKGSLRRVRVVKGLRLPYAAEVLKYAGAVEDIDQVEPLVTTQSFETDLLILDKWRDHWIPRVVIECKFESISTHDALTYSTKAAAHKHVHPYLRYGILIGLREHYPLPGRLIRHGAHFDFMASWKGARPTPSEWSVLCRLLRDEVKASRSAWEMMTTNRSSKRKRYTVLHRPLRLR